LDGGELAALDLVQHGLAGHAECLGGLGERHEAVGDVGDEARADVVGDADAPRRAGGRLLAREQTFTQPAVDRCGRDAELIGGVLDGEGLAVGVW
jgi:hypothetical protein